MPKKILAAENTFKKYCLNLVQKLKNDILMLSMFKKGEKAYKFTFFRRHYIDVSAAASSLVSIIQ